MDMPKTMIITGTSRGIGFYLANHYLEMGFRVVGCGRGDSAIAEDNYQHFCVDVTDESAVKKMFSHVRSDHGKVDILINNAGVASMNHILLSPVSAVERIFATNVCGTFLFCREAAKLMKRADYGRIVNFSTIAVPLKLEGEAIYAASKAAVVMLTQIMSKEFAPFNITVNAVGPTPVKTDLIRSVPEHKIQNILKQQAIHRYGEFSDISNVIDFFIRPESSFVTGQVLYLGGV